MKWKETHDNDYYIRCFNEQVLSKLNAYSVIMDLKHLCNKSLWDDVDICLICYEKPDDFCHRHLVAYWLIQNGIECEEWK